MASQITYIDQINPFPDEIENLYHQLFPLEQTDLKSYTFNPIQISTFRINRRDGIQFCMKRIHGENFKNILVLTVVFRLSKYFSNRSPELWQMEKHSTCKYLSSSWSFFNKSIWWSVPCIRLRLPSMFWHTYGRVRHHKMIQKLNLEFKIIPCAELETKTRKIEETFTRICRLGLYCSINLCPKVS